MCCRGYANHDLSETDSDGDGGSRAKLRGPGHIEFSKKGIPHGILHFPRQIELAGHIYMHDVTASEGAHRLFVKKVIDRVRKGSEYDTCSSSIDWMFRVRTWAKIIDDVNGPAPPKRQRKEVESMKVLVNKSKMLTPTANFTHDTGQHTFSPLRTGGDRLLGNDARLSYNELGQLVSSFTGWDEDFVNDTVQIKLYCSAERLGPGKTTLNLWTTEHRYQYNGGSRRDMVEVDLGQGRAGCAQITAFIEMYGDVDHVSEGVIIRWMEKSVISRNTDSKDRPICDYPLSFNHCLWQWSKTGVVRGSFRARGFENRVTRDRLWSHVLEKHRPDVIRSEKYSRYDILGYDSIVGHVNIHEDPSTGYMLQTVQIV